MNGFSHIIVRIPFLQYKSYLTNMEKTIGRMSKRKQDQLVRHKIKNDFVQKEATISYDITPDNVRSKLTQASQGEIGGLQELYVFMASDGHYQGLVKSLVSSVVACPIKLERPKRQTATSEKAFKLVEEMFERLDTNVMMREGCRPYLRGVAAWQNNFVRKKSYVDGNNYIFLHKHKPLTPVPGILLSVDLRNDSPTFGELMIREGKVAEPVPLSSYQYGTMIFREDEQEAGYQEYLGAARRSLNWWLSKKFQTLWWNRYNETFGEPTRIAYVNELNMEQDDIRDVESYLKYMGRDLYGIFPDDVEIQLQSHVTQGTINTYEQLMQFADDQITMAVLGRERTGNAQGSYAREKEENVARKDIIANICGDIHSMFMEQIMVFLRYNIDVEFDEVDAPKAIPIPPDPEGKAVLADVYTKITDMIDVPVKHIRRTFGIPEVEDGEETFGPTEKMKRQQTMFENGIKSGTDQPGKDQVRGKGSDLQSKRKENNREDSSKRSKGSDRDEG